MIALTPIVLSFSLAAPPQIVKVVVFPDGAQVTRRTSVICTKETTVRFEALPPATQPGTLRATTNAGTVVGLREEEVPLTDAFSAERAEAEAKLRSLAAQDAVQVDLLERLTESTRLASAYDTVAVSSMASEAASAPPLNTAAWQTALDLGLSSRLKAADKRTAINATRRSLAEQMAEVRNDLARTVAGAQRKQNVAEALLSCPLGATAAVELTYHVGGAGWQPTYEARPTADSSGVDLAAYATVAQSTGEPWSHVELVLSSAVPKTEATPPQLQPLKISAEERAPERKVLVRRNEEREHAETSTQTVAAPTPAQSPAPSAGLAALSEGLSVQLSVPDRADVAGDGKPARLFIAQQRIPATFADRTAPQLQPFVFRVADLTNTAPFPLLAGPVDAFGKSGFLGRYALERVAQGAPFHLTFGIEEDLHIRRIVLEEVQRDTGLFNGNHRFRYGYRYELESYSPTPRTVELMEGYPVSELDDVHAELDPTSSPGFENLAEDGRVVWKVPLAPRETAKRELHFHVDVPSSYDLAGL